MNQPSLGAENARPFSIRASVWSALITLTRVAQPLQPIQFIEISRAVIAGAKAVARGEVVVDLCIACFIFNFGIGLGARVAPIKPDQERNERGQDGNEAGGHGLLVTAADALITGSFTDAPKSNATAITLKTVPHS